MFRISMVATGVAVALTGCGSSSKDLDCVANPLVGRDCTPEVVIDEESGVVTVQADDRGSVAFDVSSINLDDNNTPDDATDDFVTITGGDFDAEGKYVRAPSLDRGGLEAYKADFNEQETFYSAIRATTPSGLMSVSMVGTGNYRDYGDYYAGYTRGPTSNLPTTGNANYVGKYAGMITYGGSGGVGLTTGDVKLLVEFQDNFRTKGSITNRRVVGGSAPAGRDTNQLALDGAGNIVAVESTAPLNQETFQRIVTSETLTTTQQVGADGTLVTVVGSAPTTVLDPSDPRTVLLPGISLDEATYDFDGQFQGVATTTTNGVALDAGTYSATLGGPNGNEMAGYFTVTGGLLDGRLNVTTQEIGVFTGVCQQGNPKLSCSEPVVVVDPAQQ